MDKKFINLFKKYFIPHETNDYKPHILKRKSLIFILALVVLAEAVFLSQIFLFSPGSGLMAEILKSVLIEDTNGNRLAGSVPELKENILLSVAAQNKARDMAVKGYFSHTGPDGAEPWSWIDAEGYEYSYAGENLAVNFSDSKEVVNAWMNSPGHRENILNNNFTEIGIGVAQGIYQNRTAVFVVQFLGKPLEEQTIAPVEKPAATAPVIAVTEPVQISGVEVLSAETNLAEQIISSPKTRTQYFYLALMAIIILALILNILVKVKIQHPRVILNGVILIIIINVVLLINSYFFSGNIQIF